jgi:hypothetical protein
MCFLVYCAPLFYNNDVTASAAPSVRLSSVQAAPASPFMHTQALRTVPVSYGRVLYLSNYIAIRHKKLPVQEIPMGLFSAKLDQLEARLQTLIEGHLARLFPVQEYRDEFIQRLVYAMKSRTQIQADGSSLAPDAYVLLIHPDLVPRIDANERLLGDLGSIIQEVGANAGLIFAQSPMVSVSPNSDVGKNSVDVIARISMDMLAKTVESVTQSETDINNIPPNAFLIVNGVMIFPLDHSLVNIGRRSNNDLVIDDPRISRAHAQLRAIRGVYVLSDLDSKGGTFVNDQRVTQRTLRPRDVISLAGVPLVYGQDDVNLEQTQQIGPNPPSHDDDANTKDDVL